MARPSDFSPSEAIEIDDGDARNLRRDIWALRITGAFLLVIGWATVSLHDVGSATFFLVTIVLATLGAYAFIAPAVARRFTLNLEKKLRLRLLVHNMELESMAMRDDLTQLFNRRYLFDRLERELQTARALNRELAVVLMDVDQLKAVNDSYGHRMGDRALTCFGQFLLEHTRASDVPARIGGDEFAILLADTSKRGACDMMSRLLKDLESRPLIDEDGLTLHLSASCGISGYPWGGEDVDALIQDADAGMYAHKRARKNVCLGATDDGDSADPTAIPTAFRKLGSEDAGARSSASG